MSGFRVGVDVVVVGAGVSGLSTAVCLAEAGLAVRVDAALGPEATSSAAAGAMWDPYLVGPADRVAVWSRVTLAELRALAGRPGTGVRLVEGSHQSRRERVVPEWAAAVGAVPCPVGGLRPGYAMGWRYRAPLVDMPAYLAHLTERLAAAGGSVRTRTYSSLAEARAEAPVVVNCSGSGARRLVPDRAVTATGGQLVVVANPGIREFFCDDTPDAPELTYIYPHGDTVVLGGTAEPGLESRAPSADVTREILGRCAEVEPLLRGARVVGERVGFRPVRPEVRLAEEPVSGGRLLHNYGHGGAGVTLSWGCAREITALVLGEWRTVTV